MKNVIWLDIETTGLDEQNHSLLCVGAVRFDEGWTNERKFYQIVHHPNPEKLLWSPTALDMHRKSGLYDQIKRPVDALSITDVAMNLPPVDGMVVPLETLDVNLCRWGIPILELVHTPKASWPKLMLAGNSIHFDRKFIRKYLPLFEGLLHYRMIDVSGMAEAARIFGGVQVKRPEYSHRAMEDAYSSIQLLKNCLEALQSKGGTNEGQGPKSN